MYKPSAIILSESEDKTMKAIMFGAQTAKAISAQASRQHEGQSYFGSKALSSMAGAEEQSIHYA